MDTEQKNQPTGETEGVADQTNVTALAGQTADTVTVNEPVTTQVDAAGQTGEKPEMTEKEKGLLAAKEAETKRRQQAEQTVSLYEQQMANMLQTQQNQVSQTPARKDYFAEQGLEDDDMPTVGQLREYAGRMQVEGQQERQKTRKLEEARSFIASKTDYADVVGTNVGENFIPSESLQRALQINPELRNALNDPSTAPMLAYSIAKQHRQLENLQEKTKTNEQFQSQQMAQNKTSPLSSVSVGSGGAMSEITRISSMDDEQFAKLERSVLRGERG